MMLKALLVTACGATRLIDWIEPGEAVPSRLVTPLRLTVRPYYLPPVEAPLAPESTLATRRFSLADELYSPAFPGRRIYVYVEDR